MQSSAILDAVQTQLNDAGATTWSLATLLDYLNKGRRSAVTLRPDLFRSRRSVQLATGPSQTVPTDCAHLFGLTDNMGADGGTRGEAIHLTDGATMEALEPRWRSRPGSVIREYILADPKGQLYEVNPPVASDATVYVELDLAAFPADLTKTDGTEDLGLSERWEMALVHFVLHMALREETEASAKALADGHYQHFLAELGVGSDQSG